MQNNKIVEIIPDTKTKMYLQSHGLIISTSLLGRRLLTYQSALDQMHIGETQRKYRQRDLDRC